MQNDGSITSSGYGNVYGTANLGDAGDASPIKQFFRNKWVRLILIVDVITIIVVIAIIVNNATKTATINFNIAPVDASIQIGATGGGGYTNGSYNLHPGTYDITISHDGLESKTFTLDLQSGYSTTLTTFLTGEGNNFDFYTLKDNYDSLQKLIAIASQDSNITTDHDTSAEQFIADFQHNHQFLSLSPIVDKTPSKYGKGAGIRYEYDTLKIEDGFSLEQCTHVLCLRITDTSGEKEKYALSVVKKLGYDPDAFQVIYEKVPYE